MIHCPFYRAHKKCVWYIFSYIYVFFPKWQSKKPKTSSYCFSPSKSKRFSSIRKPFATWLESIMESLISLDSCLNNYPWGKDGEIQWSTICLSNEHSLLFQMCSRALELVEENNASKLSCDTAIVQFSSKGSSEKFYPRCIWGEEDQPQTSKLTNEPKPKRKCYGRGFPDAFFI